MFRRSLVVGAFAAAAALVAGTAGAADREHKPNTFEITPFAGYMAGGGFEDPVDNSDRDLDGASNYGVIFDAAAEYWRHSELLYSQQSTTGQGATPIDLDIQYLQSGGIVSHPDMQRVIPYFGMTFGAAQFSPDAPGLDDETKFAITVGGGVRIPITDHIGVRFDARGFVTFFDTNGEIFCASTGGVGTCRIRASGSTFFQYAASLGLTIGF